MSDYICVNCECSKVFEAATGMLGVSGQYHLPSGWTPNDLKRMTVGAWEEKWSQYAHYAAEGYVMNFPTENLKEECDTFYSNILSPLVYLNPDLGEITIDPDNPAHKMDIILGVASAYNVQDIDFYINHRSEWDSVHNNQLATVNNKLSILFGTHSARVTWIASPHTLMQIDLQIAYYLGPALPPGTSLGLGEGSGDGYEL